MQLRYSEAILFIVIYNVSFWTASYSCLFYFNLTLPLNLDEIIIPLPLEEKNMDFIMCRA
jgi:hypothetical protein